MGIDLDQAIKNMNDSWIVGIVEAYHESICLLYARSGGQLPPGCNCENPLMWNAMSLSNDTHGTDHPDLEDFPREVTDAVSKLVQNDEILYKAAVSRFLHDIEYVE